MNERVASRSGAAVEGDVPPAWRLSYEIWAEIFSLCLPRTKFVRPSPYDAPLLLCGVCAEWREIALATPQLWSSLAVRISYPSHLTPVFVQDWIDRSGMLPLSLSLETSALCPRSAEGTLDKTVAVLFSYASRWLNVSFTLSAPIGNALPTLDNAPLLREFSLHPSPLSKNRFAIPFNMAPHLRRLKWTPCWDLLAVRGIPWKRLTHLTLERGLSLLGCLDALRLCPKLVECGLSATLIQHLSTLSPPLQHHHLRRLRITADEHLGRFFDSLTLPHLEQLEVDLDDEYVYDVSTGQARQVDPLHPHLTNFLARSGCRLWALTLHNVNLGAEELIECLQACPELESLSIHNGHPRVMVTDQVLLRLTHPDYMPDQTLRNSVVPVHVDGGNPQSPSSLRSWPSFLCPHLQRLQLVDCIENSEGTLGRMIESRHRQPIRPLLAFSGTSSSHKLAERDLEALQSCARDGLQVAFHDVSACIS
ncbi:hypothetical protein AX17_002048 [Amanita inopinata Kibby_2008]|nr:hypothetical protein AX17_002048 [Amanita inopinata Kibby_2008]